MTPTDTMSPIRPTPNNPTDPCLCGHSRRNHGKEDDREVCFVCTHPTGGCRGFLAARPDSTAAERDAFLDGFGAGVYWINDPTGLALPHEAAEHAYRRWIDGDSEDA